jgi:predicted DNA-binding transcriptional regulator AlpA
MERNISEAAETDFVVMPKKTAKILGVSVRTLRRMQDRGEAPPRVKITERMFGYRHSEILKFLEARTVA